MKQLPSLDFYEDTTKQSRNDFIVFPRVGYKPLQAPKKTHKKTKKRHTKRTSYFSFY